MAKYLVINKDFVQYLGQVGVDYKAVFKQAGLAQKPITETGYPLSKNEYMDLLDVIDDYVTDETIYAFSDIEPLISFNPPIFAALCSSDGLECMSRLSKFKKLIGPMYFHVEVKNDLVYLEMVYEDQERSLGRFITYTEQMLCLNLIRKGTGELIKPVEVASVYPYDLARFQEFFGIETVMSNRNVMVFKLEDMIKPFVTKNKMMWQYMEPELSRRLKELELDETYAAGVRSTLIELLPAGKGNIDEVAKSMNMSPRTLQRKLSKEKTTFIKQLNHTRALLSRHYLKDPNMTNDEIAFLIGYSDANAFVRAFTSWTGQTTSQFRTSIMA